jgi:hypothetical protein
VPNPAYIHLVSCHIPIIGIPLVLVLLAIGMAMKSADVKRVALLLTVLVGLGTIPAFTSGEGAEDILEGRPGLAEALVETHEERAEAAAIATWVAGGLAAIGLLASLRGGSVPGWAASVTLLALLVSGALLPWAARPGGQISHPEARPGFSAPAEVD